MAGVKYANETNRENCFRDNLEAKKQGQII